MVAENEIKFIAENAITKHFDKFYDVTFKGRNIRVAPMSNHIPKIISIQQNDDDDLLIAFDSNAVFNEGFDYTSLVLINNTDNNIIQGFIIGDISRLSDKNYRKELRSTVQKNIDSLSGTSNTIENLDKIRIKRLLYAIRDIVEKLSKGNVNFPLPS